MRLVSDAPLPVGTTCRVRMDIALGKDYEEQLVFVTTSMWEHADVTPGLYESGWRNTLSAATCRSMQRLLDRIASM